MPLLLPKQYRAQLTPFFSTDVLREDVDFRLFSDLIRLNQYYRPALTDKCNRTPGGQPAARPFHVNYQGHHTKMPYREFTSALTQRT